MTGRWLTIPELADLIGKKPSWVQDMVTARRLPFHRLGQQIRFTPSDVATIEASTAVPVATVPAGIALVRAIQAGRPPAGPATPGPPAGPATPSKPGPNPPRQPSPKPGPTKATRGRVA